MNAHNLFIFLIICCFNLSAEYIEIKSAQEFNAKTKNSPAIVAFHRLTCPKCKVFMPAYQRIAGKFKNIQFLAVDIENKALYGLVRRYIVTTTPTVYKLDLKNNISERIKASGKVVEETAQQIQNPNYQNNSNKPNNQNLLYAKKETTYSHLTSRRKRIRL